MQVCSFISIWLSLFKRKVHLYVAFVILKVGIYACVSQHLKIKSTSSLSPLCRACLIFFSQIRNFCSKQTGKIDCDSRPSHFNDGSLFILISMATQFAGRYLRHLFYWQRAMCVLLPPPLYLTKKCFLWTWCIQAPVAAVRKSFFFYLLAIWLVLSYINLLQSHHRIWCCLQWQLQDCCVYADVEKNLPMYIFSFPV